MDSRVRNTKRNLIASYVFTALTMLFQFVSRSVIIRYLGEPYLGLSSLFTSILQVLNMAELGFSGAIVYNMYKPLAENDTETVCSLMAYYRKIYRVIGAAILGVGLLIMPLVPRLIAGGYPEEINLYILYALYLGNTAVSYFVFAYRTSLLEAMQRMDLVKTAYTLVTLLQYAAQIAALAVFRNYYLFVAAMILGSAAKNLTAAWLSRKYYPQYSCRGRISSGVRKDIISRVKGLMICNISAVTYTTFDSIILSALIGLEAVARYNNYATVRSGVTTVILLMQTAMQASVGNSVARESPEKNYRDMEIWQCLFSVITAWCVACMLPLYQPFMTLWMGEKSLLPLRDVILVCAWFNASEIQHSFLLYLNAAGLWWKMRWTYIASSATNLVLNLVLGHFWGISGILFSTVFSTVVFGSVWQCNIIFREYFRRSSRTFQLRQLLYYGASAAVAAVTYFVCGLIPTEGIGGLALKAVCGAAVSGMLLWLIFRRFPVFRRAMEFLKRAMKERIR